MLEASGPRRHPGADSFGVSRLNVRKMGDSPVTSVRRSKPRHEPPAQLPLRWAVIITTAAAASIPAAAGGLAAAVAVFFAVAGALHVIVG